MQYEPFKNRAGRLLKKSVFLRKLFYFILGILLLRFWYFKRFLKNIRMKIPRDASVLDAGSGMGQNAWWMAKHNPGWKIKGVDIITEQVNDCSDFFSKTGYTTGIKFETADLLTFREENMYDLIISNDVMEHIENDVAVFRNFYSSLRPGGILLLTTPSDKGGSGTDTHSGESFIDEHVRNGYSPEEISGKLNSTGFTSVNISFTYGKPGYLAWIISVKIPLSMVNISRWFFILLPFYYLIVLPAAFLLNLTDINTVQKSGTGLIVTAEKK